MLQAGESAFESRLQTIFFSPPKRPNWLWGPPSLLFDGYRGSFPGLIRSGRDFNHSPQSSAEVKKEWSYTSSPPLCLHDVDRENVALFISVTWNKPRTNERHKIAISDSKKASCRLLRDAERCLTVGGCRRAL